MSAARWAAIALTGSVAALATVLAFAPATVVDLALERVSLGRVRLAQAQGTVWNGSGRILLTEAAAQAGMPSGFAVPGTLRWRLRPLPLVFGLVDATLSIDGMPSPVRIDGNPDELRVAPGTLTLPPVDLSRLGSPWNTIRPTAGVSARWASLAIRKGVLDGEVSVELVDVASAMTPVRPLGTYRIDVRGNGRDVALALSTSGGALRLEGSGQWDRRQGLRFGAQASADGEQRVRLQSLLTLIGRREGDRTIIRIGGGA